MFYHILVKTKAQGKEKSEMYSVYDFDSMDNVVQEFGIPYTTGEDFFVDGYKVNSHTLKRFYVAESDSSISVLQDNFRARIRNSNVFMMATREMLINDDSYARDVTSVILEKAKSSSNSNKKISPVITDNKSVFIVHGRDDGLKAEVARFIQKIGLSPIILHEQVSSSLTIIEKLEKYTNVGFAIVLYTSCDVGSLKDTQVLKPRARQNVVFEHGFLTGKLGRSRVCALVENSVELPNDISGVVFVDYDKSGSWMYTIAKEIKALGYSIDMDAI